MFRALLLLLLAQDALSLQIAVRPLAPATLSRSPAVHAQFGGGEKPKGLSRDSEPEEFFKTNMDAMSDEEKLKSPVVWIGLSILVLPFIAGVIALEFSK
ncbi:hypothetical protein EMIHUDRAFT_225121 [Emiliania huxleyi CCMP1516]|uniref:Uncharacterized protein n=2 Tax=Emiliania huxleyi TaxID=2903 RepID=A0A0D3KQ04_EMIH1|nr:hypothetical protein EMIHUDRAFT_225121 [Emiliania huxleyi CCMP1516]EOD37839.1 hypothetical protein EMIHUDRAFT_225121 [Emiliania huxleyi CCMP1516]|eukprot:XP_005790268.1 hypothetical protein EMIHUDRAFT_225121 [Emiliania huxleyi CCMP1516]